MGQRGPAKTPTAVLDQRGSWRGKIRKGEPTAHGAPVMPDDLDENERAVWQRVVPRLVAMGVAGEVDSDMIARYCTTYVVYLKLRDFVRKHTMPIPIRNDAGEIEGFKELPHVARMMKVDADLARTERLFGISAGARASLAIELTSKQHNAEESAEEDYADRTARMLASNPLKLA